MTLVNGTGSTRDTAIRLCEQGLPITLCRGKKPLGYGWERGVKNGFGEAWQTYTWTPQTIDAAFCKHPRLNVGVRLGPDSKWIDIEADSEEEERLFAELFNGTEHPVTPTYRSARGKHRLFQYSDQLATTNKAVVYYAKKLGVRIGVDKGAQSVMPPSAGRVWLRNLDLDSCNPAPLPEAVIRRILHAANGHATKSDDTEHNGDRSPGTVHAAALQAMLAIGLQDNQDGSKRLYTAACRAVEHDLSDADAVATIRVYTEQKPFPRRWNDADIIKRIRDAERKDVVRGSKKDRAQGDYKASIEPYTPCPIDCLPEPVRDFVSAVSTAQHCDPSFVALPLLCGLAGAVGATRWVQPKAGWAEPCVLWGAIVGESGTQKSPAQKTALAPLEEMQAWHLDQLPEMQRRYAEELALYESDRRRWQNKGRTSGEPPPLKPEEPAPTRYVVSNSTIEALAPLLKQNPRGLLLATDELTAWLGGMDRYARGNGEVGQWLSMYRAERLLRDRRTGDERTIYVPRAACSIIGGIPPATFRKHVQGDHLENGLAARLLVVMPPRRPKQWSDAEAGPAVMKRIERIYGRLLALDYQTNLDTPPEPLYIDMAPDARDLFRQFVNRHGQEQLNYTGHLASVWSKLEAVAARLALLSSLVGWADGDGPADHQEHVGAADVERGIILVRWFGQEWCRLYSSYSESDDQRAQRELIEWITARGGQTTVRELQRGLYRHRGDAAFCERALNELERHGHGKWIVDRREGGRGAPRRVFVLEAANQ